MSWIQAAKSSDVPTGTGKLVIVDDYLIALFHIDGVFYAIDDACPHQGAPLSEGVVRGCIAICPWHGAEFDITNGKLLCGPGVRDVKAYPVKIEDDDVLIEIS
ncbi:Rieske (2Fe-2S) protein [Novipirellula sp.]|uniref:Rieske (2Fe-2S) protein n=1 Tax=Novipirellula sp. TaxID=2795430 RepID=UPI0035644159